MKKVLASFFTIILVVAVTLAAIFLLVRATLYVTALSSPLARAGAIVAELFLGVVLLLGTVWVLTKNRPAVTESSFFCAHALDANIRTGTTRTARRLANISPPES